MRNERKQKIRRRHAWNEESELLLFNLWSQRLRDMRSTTKTGYIYNEMAAELRKLGYPFGGRAIQIKIQNVTSRYRKEKAAMSAPSGKPTTWKFYNKINKIIGDCNDVIFGGEVKMESIDDYSMTSNPSQYTPLLPGNSSPLPSSFAPTPSAIKRGSPQPTFSVAPAPPSPIHSITPPSTPDLLTKKRRGTKDNFQNEVLRKFDQLSTEIAEHLSRCEENDEKLINIEKEKANCLKKIANDNEELKNALIFFLKRDD